MNTTSFAAFLETKDTFEVTAGQILDIFDAEGYIHGSQRVFFEGFGDLIGGEEPMIPLHYVYYTTGDSDRGTVNIPARFMDTFDVEEITQYAKDQKEKNKEASKRRLEEAARKKKAEEATAAINTLVAGGMMSEETAAQLKADFLKGPTP